MVFSNKIVLCILVDGKPQKELANGVVKLPFGAEYEIRVRNKNNRRGVAKIFVDGKNVSGNGYIVEANDHIDLKRHHDIDRAFKFVDLDSPEAVDAGKNGPNTDKQKGVIEVRFHLEKERPTYTPWWPYKEEHHHHHHHHHDHYPITPSPWYYPQPIWLNDNDMKFTCDASSSPVNYSSPDIGIMRDCEPASASFSTQNSTSNASIEQSMKGAVSQRRCKARLQDETKTCSISPTTSELRDGCTVEGGRTGQTFTTSWIEYEDTFTTLKVFLQGYDSEELEEVREPVHKSRKTNKDSRIDDLEAENERLRRELAEIENQKFKDELAKKKRPQKRRALKKDGPSRRPKKREAKKE